MKWMYIGNYSMVYNNGKNPYRKVGYKSSRNENNETIQLRYKMPVVLN